VNLGKIDQKGAIRRDVKKNSVFQQGAVCLTKFGPESGETADEILARKNLERRSGTRAHKNEFWWGIGEKGAAQSINRLISQHGAKRHSTSFYFALQTPIWLKCHYEQSEAIQGECYANPSS
jgi:hypothetical protein